MSFTHSRRPALRLPRESYADPSAIFFVTIGVLDRARVFDAKEFAVAVVDVLRRHAERSGVELFAYCIMPDHVHLLVRPSTRCDVVDFVGQFKSLAARESWRHGSAERSGNLVLGSSPSHRREWPARGRVHPRQPGPRRPRHRLDAVPVLGSPLAGLPGTSPLRGGQAPAPPESLNPASFRSAVLKSSSRARVLLRSSPWRSVSLGDTRGGLFRCGGGLSPGQTLELSRVWWWGRRPCLPRIPQQRVSGLDGAAVSDRHHQISAPTAFALGLVDQRAQFSGGSCGYPYEGPKSWNTTPQR